MVRGEWLHRSGFTLVEVIVVIAVLGLVVGISVVALASLKSPPQSARDQELLRARAEAIQTGRPVVTDGNHAPRTTHLLFLPDGRAVGTGVDPLTGAPSAR